MFRTKLLSVSLGKGWKYQGHTVFSSWLQTCLKHVCSRVIVKYCLIKYPLCLGQLYIWTIILLVYSGWSKIEFCIAIRLPFNHFIQGLCYVMQLISLSLNFWVYKLWILVFEFFSLLKKPQLHERRHHNRKFYSKVITSEGGYKSGYIYIQN